MITWSTLSIFKIPARPPQTRGKPLEKQGLVPWEIKDCKTEEWARIQEAVPNLLTIENPVKSAPILSGMHKSSKYLTIRSSTPTPLSWHSSFISYLKSPCGGQLAGGKPMAQSLENIRVPAKSLIFTREYCKARSTTGLRAPLVIISLALLCSILISPTPPQLSL